MSPRQVIKKAHSGTSLAIIAALAALSSIIGCRLLPEASIPLPAKWIQWTEGKVAPNLVIFLPGRGEGAETYRKKGFIEKMRSTGWNADALLLDAHLGYYASRTLTERFETEVLPIIQTRRYQQVWIVGISLGGLGGLLIDRYFPETIDGLILLAPFLGDKNSLLTALEAQGLSGWTPPTSVEADDFELSLWIHLKGALQTGAFQNKVWLGFGTEDRYHRWHSLLANALPSENVVRDDGGAHNWESWSILWDDLLKKIPFSAP